MANLLYLQFSSPSSSHLAACHRRSCSVNCKIDLWRSIVSRNTFECRASRGPGWDGGGHFRYRAEEELFRDEGFSRFEFGYSKKKRPWWFDDDDDYDELMNDEEDWSMVFEVFRTISWMLAPIGISLLLGTDSDAGLMALAVPLVQSLMSLVFSKVLSRPNIIPIKRSRRGTFSRSASESRKRTRKARQEENMGGGVDKGGYKSWMVGDTDSNSMSSEYGGWDVLDKQKEIRNGNPSNENVRSKQHFKRKGSRRWRVKEKPLLLRMLIATFPLLGSWTKLLF